METDAAVLFHFRYIGYLRHTTYQVVHYRRFLFRPKELFVPTSREMEQKDRDLIFLTLYFLLIHKTSLYLRRYRQNNKK